MTARRWRPAPGDVALVRNKWDVWNLAICTVAPGGDVWRFGVSFSEQPVEGSDARQVLVFDPNDREQVERLLVALPAYWNLTQDDQDAASSLTELQAALRSLLPPPKPEEPTDPGTVVVDVNGDRHMRLFDGETKNWLGEDGEVRSWGAVEVLSPGVGGEA